MPAGAKAARGKAGNIIPMVLVTSADGKKEIEGISYAKLKEDIRDANRDLKKKLETVDVLGNAAESEETTVEAEAPAVEEPSLLAENQAWTNSDGKEITAAVKAINGDNVVFVMNGREVPYPLAKLSAESRGKVEALAKE